MKMQNKKRGFTIVELVIVIAVIAILAGVLVPTFTGIVKKAQISAAQQEATSTYHAILGATEFAELDEAESGPDAYFLVNNGKYYVELTDGELSDPVEIKKDVTLPENVKTTATNINDLTVGEGYYLPAKILTDIFNFEEEENYTAYVYCKVTALQKAKAAYEVALTKDDDASYDNNDDEKVDAYVKVTEGTGEEATDHYFSIEKGEMRALTEAPAAKTLQSYEPVTMPEFDATNDVVFYKTK